MAVVVVEDEHAALDLARADWAAECPGTPMKLPDGTWGAKIRPKSASRTVAPGTRCLIRTRSGKKYQTIVTEVVGEGRGGTGRTGGVSREVTVRCKRVAT